MLILVLGELLLIRMYAAILYVILNFLHNRRAFTRLLKNMAQKYWIQVTTEKPRCIYYFGSFLTKKRAKLA